MATLTLVNPRVVSGDTLEKVTALIKNGESWKAGQWLTINSSGQLTASVSDEDAATGGIQYIAPADISDPANATTTTEVLAIGPDAVFEGNVYHGTAASALATTAQIGMQYGINVASNVVSIDIAETTSPAVIVTEIGSIYAPIDNSAADVYGRIRFKLLTTVREAVLAA